MCCWMEVILVHDMHELFNQPHYMIVVFGCVIFKQPCLRIGNFPNQIVLILLVLGGSHVLTSRWSTRFAIGNSMSFPVSSGTIRLKSGYISTLFLSPVFLLAEHTPGLRVRHCFSSTADT